MSEGGKKKKLGKLFGGKRKTKTKALTTATLADAAQTTTDISATSTVAATTTTDSGPSVDNLAAALASRVTGDWAVPEPTQTITTNFTAVKVGDIKDEPAPEVEKHIGEVMDEEEAKRAFWQVRKSAVKKNKKKPEAEAAAPAPAPAAAPEPTTFAEFARRRRMREAAASGIPMTGQLRGGSLRNSKKNLDVASDMQFPTLGPKSDSPAPKDSLASNCWASLNVESDSEEEEAPAAPEPVVEVFGVGLEGVRVGMGDALSSSEFRAEADSMIKEYRSTHDVEELVKRVKQLPGDAADRSIIAARMVELAADWSKEDMELVDKAFTALVGESAIARESVVDGLSLVFEDFDSLCLDVPLLGTYTATMLKTIVEKGVVPHHVLPTKVATKLGVDNSPPTAAAPGPSAAAAPPAPASSSSTDATPSASDAPAPSADAAPAPAPAAEPTSEPAAAAAASSSSADAGKKKKKKKKGFQL